MFYISTKTLLVVGISSILCQFVSALAMYHIHNINKLYCLILTFALLCLYPYCYLASQQHNLCLHPLCDSLQGSPLFFPVLHPEEIWGQCFQLGIWSTFLNTSTFLLSWTPSFSAWIWPCFPPINSLLPSHILYCGF